MTQISRTEFVTPKTEQQIVAKAMEQTDTTTDTQEPIKSETSIKQEAINKLTKLIDLFEKKIATRKILDPEKQRWARLEIEAIRTLGTLLTQSVKQEINQTVDLHVNHTVELLAQYEAILREEVQETPRNIQPHNTPKPLDTSQTAPNPIPIPVS